MLYRSQKSFQCLTGKGTPPCIRNRHRQHNRYFKPGCLHSTLRCQNSGFCIQRIKNSFYQQSIYPTFKHRFHLLLISIGHFIISHGTIGRIIHIRRHGTCFIGRTNRTGHKTRFIGIECRIFIGNFSCQLHGRLIDFTHILLYMIIGHRNCGGTKCIRLNDIGTGFQIFTVYILNHVRARETK